VKAYSLESHNAKDCSQGNENWLKKPLDTVLSGLLHKSADVLPNDIFTWDGGKYFPLVKVKLFKAQVLVLS
jgi:hypothetical protein